MLARLLLQPLSTQAAAAAKPAFEITVARMRSGLLYGRSKFKPITQMGPILEMYCELLFNDSKAIDQLVSKYCLDSNSTTPKLSSQAKEIMMLLEGKPIDQVEQSLLQLKKNVARPTPDVRILNNMGLFCLGENPSQRVATGIALMVAQREAKKQQKDKLWETGVLIKYCDNNKGCVKHAFVDGELKW